MPPHATTASTKPPQGRLTRSLGNHVHMSVAAEWALEWGDEMEDALWLGSGRLDGSLVRRHLCSSSWGGSQRFLRSMRFWGSLHLHRG
jgi:hypothetical protein